MLRTGRHDCIGRLHLHQRRNGHCARLPRLGFQPPAHQRGGHPRHHAGGEHHLLPQHAVARRRREYRQHEQVGADGAVLPAVDPADGELNIGGRLGEAERDAGDACGHARVQGWEPLYRLRGRTQPEVGRGGDAEEVEGRGRQGQG